MKQYLIILISLILIVSTATAQKITISGYIKDKSNGEVLIGANIYEKGTSIGASTNAYGFYSLTMPAGKHSLIFSYMGYQSIKLSLNLSQDTTINMELLPQTQEIEEVVVSARKDNENVVSTDVSMQKLNSQTIKKIPVLMGEADMIKSLQLMPGVKSVGSMSSGMSIRGGSRDQNLLLLDEAPVYNASHLSGLFSVFNNDAIKNVKLYKANIPARYGGRLSSLLDIRMNDGNSKRISGTGGIGLISSRLTLEGPVVKDKSSFIISGRRTYMDVIVDLVKDVSKNKNIQRFPIHFYDLNAKFNYEINANNRIFASGYFGRDVFSYSLGNSSSSEFDWGNYTTTLRWNHVFNQKLFSNVTLLASNYDYLLDNEFTIGEDEIWILSE
jgi:hypothetical protein